jgi:hypothetical protein
MKRKFDEICSRLCDLHVRLLFFKLTSEQKRKIQQRVETYPFKNPPHGGEGKAKGSTNLTRKM